MIEITVDDRPLDLGPDTQVVQSFQANNLERPDQVNTQTKKPYRKLSARIKADGVETVPFGVAQLEESKSGAFSLQIFSGNKDFFATLADKSIRDLPLGEWDHEWSLNNVINSRGHHYGNGYVYDIINRGKDGQANASRWNDLYPSVFVRVLWEKVFEQAGFSYAWQRDDEGLFEKLLLPAVAAAKLDEGYRKAREIFVTRTDRKIGRGRAGSAAPKGETDAWIVAFDKTGPEPYFVGDANPWNGATYAADGHYYVDVLGSFEVDGFASVATFGVKVQILKNGQVEREVEKKYQNASLTSKRIRDFILVDEQRIKMQPGDTLQVRISTRKVNPLTSFDATILVTENQGLDIRVREEFAPGATVRLNSWLPDISQKEFVKSIIFLYGLMMQTDPYTQTIRINYFSDLIKRLPVALDWSDKLDLSGEITTEYTFGGFAQRNYIRYIGDQKDESTRFADGLLTVDNENLDKEKAIITLPYAATVTQAGIPIIEMYKARRKEQEGDPTEYDQVDAAPRILIREDLQLPYN